MLQTASSWRTSLAGTYDLNSATLIAVVPILVGPLQVLLTLLPAILMSVGGIFLALLKPAAFKQILQLLWRQKWPLLATAALLAGGGWGLRAWLAPAQDGPDKASTEAAGDWPAFRGGPQRRGATGTGPDPVRGGTRWTFASEAQTFYSSPALVGGRIYVTSAEKGVFTDRGTVYCLDADSGAVLWKNGLDGFRATFSSPSVAGKYLVCGEGLHFTRDGRVICLDVTQRGKLLWEYSTHSHVESSPCLHEGRAYIGAGDDGYYCFELEPGSAGEARVVWHASGDQFPDAETSPIVQDGKFFAGLGLGGRALVCLDAATGQELWRLPTPYPVFTPPTLEGGRVLFGMGNGNLVETADQAAAKELGKLRKIGATDAELSAADKQLRATGEVWCVEIATQKVLWKFTLPEVVLGAVVSDGNGCYFGSRDGRCYYLDNTGKEIVRFNARSPIVTSSALGKEHVYFVTDTGRLFALNRGTLQPEWETPLGGAGPCLSSPTVGRGHIYVGTSGEGLLCVGGADGAPRREVWGGYLGGPGQAGNTDGSLLPDRGVILGRYLPVGGQIVAPPAAAAGLLLVPVAGGPKKGLLCFDMSLEGEPQPLWHFSTAHGVWQSPAFVDGWAYCTDGVPGQPNRHLYALEARTGQLRHKVALRPDAPAQAVICGSRVVLQSSPNDLTAFEDFALSRSHTTKADGLIGFPAVNHSILVYASTNGLTAADSHSLQTLWQAGLALLTGPVIHDKTIYLGTPTGVEAFSLLDGSQQGVIPGGTPVTPLMLSGNRTAWINARQELMVADAQDGQVLANLPDALTNVPPVLTRDQLLYATPRGLMICRLGEFQPRLWLKPDEPFSFTSPIIVAKSRVYFGSDKGLIWAGRSDHDNPRE